MKLFYGSMLLFLLSFLDMHISMNTPWNSHRSYVTVNINSENITFPFTSLNLAILDLGPRRTVDQAHIVSSPVRMGGLRCFFHSPSNGEISEIFHEFLPFSSGIQDAEYMNCFGIIKDDMSVIFLQRANGLPIISRSETKKRRTWNTMDVGSVDIRYAALIDPAYDVAKCEFKFTDGSVRSVDEIGRLVDMVGTVEGLACRKPWSFRDLLPFRRGS